MDVISRIWALSWVALFAFFTISCTGQQEGPIRGDVEVLLPWSDESGVVAPRPVLLRGVEDMAKMQGRYGHFEVESEWSGDGVLSGYEPRARFVREDSGVLVPIDERSGRMASLYAHLDRLSLLEERLGLSALQVDPLRVAIDVVAHTSEGKWVDNALYDHDLKALLFAPDRETKLPLSLNPGVIAHERFHALFARIMGRGSPHHGTNALVPWNKTVGQKPGGQEPLRQPTPTDPNVVSERYQEVYWNALNEGMADIWGWLYSGNGDFMKLSFPVRGESRRLRAQRQLEADTEFLSEAKLRSEIAKRWGEWRDPEISIRRFAYEVSVQFARKAYADITKTRGESLDEKTRAELAGRLVSVLKNLAEVRESSEGKSLPELRAVVESLSSDPVGPDEVQKPEN